MGMIGNYLRINEEELNSYFTDSNLLEDRIYNETNVADENLLDVDKNWEGLFYLLTGQSLATFDEATPPLCWLSSYDQLIDAEQDLGYGPATYATIEQAKAIGDVLNNISEDQLAANFNADKMNEMDIYPAGVWQQEGVFQHLADSFLKLKDFYNKAAANNQAVIFFIN